MFSLWLPKLYTGAKWSRFPNWMMEMKFHEAIVVRTRANLNKKKSTEEKQEKSRKIGGREGWVKTEFRKEFDSCSGSACHGHEPNS